MEINKDFQFRLSRLKSRFGCSTIDVVFIRFWFFFGFFIFHFHFCQEEQWHFFIVRPSVCLSGRSIFLLQNFFYNFCISWRLFQPLFCIFSRFIFVVFILILIMILMIDWKMANFCKDNKNWKIYKIILLVVW